MCRAIRIEFIPRHRVSLIVNPVSFYTRLHIGGGDSLDLVRLQASVLIPRQLPQRGLDRGVVGA
jgi:hypothetical protein